MNTEHNTLQDGPGANESGPANGKYHDMLPFVRRLLAASVFKRTAADFLRTPGFIPAVWPLGPTLLYIAVVAAGVWAAIFLGLLASLSGNLLMAAAVPGVIVVVEFILVPLIRFPAYLSRSVAAMRGFVANDRKAVDSFHLHATNWVWRDWAVLGILLACFIAKIAVLYQFGSYTPAAMLAANYIVAVADIAAHIGGVTSKVPYYALARFINMVHRRRRLAETAQYLEENGKGEAGALPYRYYEFESELNLREDEVDGTQLRRKGNIFEVRSPGTIDDGDRAAFLHRQGNCLNQTTLARALATIQLSQLDAPEMRIGNALPPTLPPPVQAMPNAAIA